MNGHLTHTECHPETLFFGVAYALTVEQARSIETVQYLLRDVEIDNTCSLWSTASLPQKWTGEVYVCGASGKTVIVSPSGAIRPSMGERYYPQHDYTLAQTPPASPLSRDSVTWQEPFPDIPSADVMI